MRTEREIREELEWFEYMVEDDKLSPDWDRDYRLNILMLKWVLNEVEEQIKAKISEYIKLAAEVLKDQTTDIEDCNLKMRAYGGVIGALEWVLENEIGTRDKE